jgi:hypothetical protein
VGLCAGWDRTEGRHGQPARDEQHDALGVERAGQALTRPQIRQRRAIRPEAEIVRAQRGHSNQTHTRVGQHALEIYRLDLGYEVQSPSQELVHGPLSVGDHTEGEAVEPGTSSPVVGIRHQHDLVPRLPGKYEGPGAHRMGADVAREPGQRPGADHRRQEEQLNLEVAQANDQGVFVHHRNIPDERGQYLLADIGWRGRVVRSSRDEIALEVELGAGRREGAAIVKANALAEVEAVRETIRADVPRFGQTRHDRPRILGEIDERLEDRPHHPAAALIVALRRVEGIRRRRQVVGENLLGRCGGGAGVERQGRRHGGEKPSHRVIGARWMLT